ncbi:MULTISPECIES: LacI family DNA-binding transcriptional regulator [Niveibacterium]|uniref:Substrate-binding domain-containing protein n=2 Tax=Betaproteobacteria TaxID=28216 RepID=A0ABX7M605_9RHOO|nr:MULTISPECIES: substrate-binding domain-containing protein [Niveibacterium]QSI76578.1 substrate-binding domain-containing protein [Niveibacterium microcysteis]
MTTDRPIPSELPENITLEMVARTAGVSPATVSRILNGSARVSERKRAAVEAVIKELNYRPNALARGLAQGRTNSIGVLTQDIASPFYGEALRGIENALKDTGAIPLIVSGHWLLRDEVERLEHLLSRRVDGLIVLTGSLPDEMLLRYATEVPLVVTGRDLEGPNLMSLRFDDYVGARMATQHLIDLGHKRIAHVAGPLDHFDSIERLRGYREALVDAGIQPDDDLVVHADFHEPGGLLAINQLIAARTPFTAVFAANDQSAFGARLALHSHGIRVPEDISVVGFDDLPVSNYVVPPLTSVKQPAYEMGEIAARALVGMIHGEPAKGRLPQPELIVRASSRPLRR